VPSYRAVAPAFPPARKGSSRSSALFFRTTPERATEASRSDDTGSGDQELTKLMPHRALQILPPAPKRASRYEEQTQVRPDISVLMQGAPRRSSAPPAPPEPPQASEFAPSAGSGRATLIGPPRGAQRMPPEFARANHLPNGYVYPYFASTREIAPTSTSVPAPPSSVAPVAMNAIPTAPALRFDSHRISAAPQVKKLSAVVAQAEGEGRPTLSWVALFVALGVLAGLLIAVFVRGDGEAVMDAMAKLVDSTNAPSTVPTPMAAAAQLPPSTASVAPQIAPSAVSGAVGSAWRPATPASAVALAMAAGPPRTSLSPLDVGVVQSPAPTPPPARPVWRARATPRAERSESSSAEGRSERVASRAEKAEKTEKPEKPDKASRGGDKDDSDKDKEKSAAEAASNLAKQQLEQALAP